MADIDAILFLVVLFAVVVILAPTFIFGYFLLAFCCSFASF